MSIASDKTIFERAVRNEMICPFVSTSINRHTDNKKAISFGLSSYGYDVRMANKLLIFKPSLLQRCLKLLGLLKPIDPKKFDKSYLKEAKIDKETGAFILPANTYALANTVEYFKIPRDMTPLCFTKSTYARSGVIIAPTVMEAGWEGQIVIEIQNTTCYDVLIYPMEGIAQLIFGIGDTECELSYADRNGKYQGQTGITMAKC